MNNAPHYAIFLASCEISSIWCRNCLIGIATRLRAEQPRNHS